MSAIVMIQWLSRVCGCQAEPAVISCNHGTAEVSKPTACSKLKLKQVALDLFQFNSENLQGREILQPLWATCCGTYFSLWIVFPYVIGIFHATAYACYLLSLILQMEFGDLLIVNTITT